MKTIEEYIKTLSLEEKTAQLYQAAAFYIKATEAENTGTLDDICLSKEQLYNVGSILNVSNVKEIKEVSNLCVSGSTAKIPPMFMLDVIHGYKTIYPIPLAMAGTFDESIVEDCAEMAAKESVAGGLQATFAPMVDLVRDARWGRVMESAGEDPYLGGVMGRAQIRGFRKGGLCSCVKHFAAYGAAEAGKEYNTTDLSDYNLYNFYLRSYEECMKEKPELVMTSFNALNGVPLNGRTDLLIDLLREKWGFDGVVISDYRAITEMIAHGFAEDEEHCAEIALNNEVDIEMVSPSYMHYLPKLVKEGRVSEEKVDRMLRRVLELKQKAGLLENQCPKANEQKENEICLSSEHRSIVRKAAEKSIVLLKNNGVLPFKKTDDFFVVGDMASEKDVMGSWRAHGKAKDCVSVLDGLKNILGDTLQTDGDIAVACIGEKSYMTGESASKVDISVSKADVDLVKNLHEKGKKVVAVIFAGRPLVLTEIEPYCDAILYVWFLGTESGNAIANILFGNAMPSAKLTMSFPRAVGQCPIYYNYFSTGRPKKKDDYHRAGDYLAAYQDEYNAPLYPFGYGLTYTNINLSSLQISNTEIEENGSLTVSVLAKNEGEYDGEEVVQLYVQDKFGSLVRPVKELKAYRKILLKKGESAKIEFALTEEMLRFYKTKDNFVSEVGEFNVFVGLNSRDCLMETIKRI